MDKLKMAHDWFISSINNGKHVTIEQAWCYADAMQAEADKREKEIKHNHLKTYADAYMNCEIQVTDPDGSCRITTRQKELDKKEWQPDKRNNPQPVITAQDKQRIEQAYSNIVKPPIVQEWQPDWSQAPEWAKAWTRDRFGGQWWDTTPSRGIDLWIADPRVPYECENAPDFNYQGNWKDSLRKRPTNI